MYDSASTKRERLEGYLAAGDLGTYHAVSFVASALRFVCRTDGRRYCVDRCRRDPGRTPAYRTHLPATCCYRCTHWSWRSRRLQLFGDQYLVTSLTMYMYLLHLVSCSCVCTSTMDNGHCRTFDYQRRRTLKRRYVFEPFGLRTQKQVPNDVSLPASSSVYCIILILDPTPREPQPEPHSSRHGLRLRLRWSRTELVADAVLRTNG